MKLTEIPAPDFNLAMTLDSGQVFHWEQIGEGFLGAIGDQPIYLEQRGEILRVPAGSAELVSSYFALDHPLNDICASFPDDPIMNAARTDCRGLRIIRQPLWECLATFLTSSMKQVTHIRQISRALRQRFGEKKEIGGDEIFSFPSPGRLARTSENELRKCGLGYRARNLLETAKVVASGQADLDSWNPLPDRKLRKQLCELPGVGMKVANCVMLFAFERIAAFPIDVWIERVLREKYFVRKRKVTGQMLADFAANYFGVHGGYAQQYLFHHARMTGKRKSRSPSINQFH